MSEFFGSHALTLLGRNPYIAVSLLALTTNEC